MHVRLGKNHGFKILLGPEPLGQLAAGCYSTASYALWKRHLCFHWSFSGTNEKQRCECIFLMWAFFLCDHRTKSSNFSFHPAEQTLQTLHLKAALLLTVCWDCCSPSLQPHPPQICVGFTNSDSGAALVHHTCRSACNWHGAADGWMLPQSPCLHRDVQCSWWNTLMCFHPEF